MKRRHSKEVWEEEEGGAAAAENPGAQWAVTLGLLVSRAMEPSPVEPYKVGTPSRQAPKGGRTTILRQQCCPTRRAEALGGHRFEELLQEPSSSSCWHQVVGKCELSRIHWVRAEIQYKINRSREKTTLDEDIRKIVPLHPVKSNFF